MRVGDGNFYLQYLRGLRDHRDVSAEGLRDLADGKRVRTASDDPAGAAVALALRARIARLAGIDRSAQSARTGLATIDRVLGEVVNVLTAARSEGLAASSDEPVANEARAKQVDALREQLLSLANTEQNGRYLFAGTRTLDAPFAADGAYSGNDAEVEAPIEPDRRVGVTLSGSRVFHDGGDLFARLEDLAQALRDGRLDDVRDSVAALRDDVDRVADVRADVGIRLRTVEDALTRHGDEKVELARRVSEIEDVRLEEVIVRIQSAGNASDALSAAAARVLGRSLFDFLG